MAGDIGYDEHLVLLRPGVESAAVERVTADLDRSAGVVHQYGERVLIVQPLAGSDGVPAVRDGVLAATPDEAADDVTATISDVEALGLAAFASEDMQEAVAAFREKRKGEFHNR